MDSHQIQLPGKIVIGAGAVEKINEVCTDLGISGKVLLITESNFMGIVGERLKEMLSSSYPVCMEMVMEGSMEEASRIGGAHEGVICVVGAGGGTVNDVGKLVSYNMKVPYIFVPTAPSHDGLSSEGVSLLKEGKKVSIKAKPPTAIIADIDMLRKAPYRLIAAGCADLISNYTAVHDWALARDRNGESFSESSAKLALFSADTVVGAAESIRSLEDSGIRTLVKAIISSGVSMSLTGSSRPASGSEHKFSHALDTLGSKALHGEQCGLGAIMMAYHQGQDWEKIREHLKSVGAPTTAKEAGIPEEMIIEALIKATHITDRYTILEEKPIGFDRAIELGKATGVI